MRRLIMCVLVAGLALSSVGCVISLDIKDVPARKQVVEIDGELYVVDVKTHRVRKIDAHWDVGAETTTATEVEYVED